MTYTTAEVRDALDLPTDWRAPDTTWTDIEATQIAVTKGLAALGLPALRGEELAAMIAIDGPSVIVLTRHGCSRLPRGVDYLEAGAPVLVIDRIKAIRATRDKLERARDRANSRARLPRTLASTRD